MSSSSLLNIHQKQEDHEKIATTACCEFVTFVITSSACQIIAAHYCHFTPKMTRTKAELKILVRKAVKVKQDHPTLSILAATRVAKVTSEEAEDRTL